MDLLLIFPIWRKNRKFTKEGYQLTLEFTSSCYNFSMFFFPESSNRKSESIFGETFFHISNPWFFWWSFPSVKKSMENLLQPWVSKLQINWWLTALHKLDLHKFPRMAISEGLPWNFSASRSHPWWHLQLWCPLHLMKILFQTLELFLYNNLGVVPTYQDGQACHHQP